MVRLHARGGGRGGVTTATALLGGGVLVIMLPVLIGGEGRLDVRTTGSTVEQYNSVAAV